MKLVRKTVALYNSSSIKKILFMIWEFLVRVFENLIKLNKFSSKPFGIIPNKMMEYIQKFSLYVCLYVYHMDFFFLAHTTICSSKSKCGHELVTHVYNPCYSGGRDEEEFGSKPALANRS
jgi:hypothetical protein